MSERIKLDIKPFKEGIYGMRSWGTFTYESRMPWGPWYLTKEPDVIFNVNGVKVIECLASEGVEDQQGFVAESTMAYDPCLRHFLVGQREDGKAIWWYQLVQEYDYERQRFADTSIVLDENQIIIRGYGGYVHTKKTVFIEVGTGAISVR